MTKKITIVFLFLLHTFLARANEIADAIKEQDYELIIKLLEEGYDPNKADDKGNTLLHRAVLPNRVKHNNKNSNNIISTILKLLPTYGTVERDNTKNNKLQIVKILLTHGADPNIANNEGKTPLHCASGSYFEIAKLLLEYGADPNIADSEGDTPLHLAVCSDYFEISELLLSYGADPNIANSEGETPLHIALEFNMEEIVKILLVNGGDQHLAIKDKETPYSKSQTPDDYYFIKDIFIEFNEKMLLLDKGNSLIKSIEDFDEEIRSYLINAVKEYLETLEGDTIEINKEFYKKMGNYLIDAVEKYLETMEGNIIKINEDFYNRMRNYLINPIQGYLKTMRVDPIEIDEDFYYKMENYLIEAYKDFYIKIKGYQTEPYRDKIFRIFRDSSNSEDKKINFKNSHKLKENKTRLPYEIWTEIAKYLSPNDFWSLANVNKGISCVLFEQLWYLAPTHKIIFMIGKYSPYQLPPINRWEDLSIEEGETNPAYKRYASVRQAN